MAKCKSKNKGHKFQGGGNSLINPEESVIFKQWTPHQYTFNNDFDLSNQVAQATKNKTLGYNTTDFGKNAFTNGYKGLEDYSLSTGKPASTSTNDNSGAAASVGALLGDPFIGLALGAAGSVGNVISNGITGNISNKNDNAAISNYLTNVSAINESSAKEAAIDAVKSNLQDFSDVRSNDVLANIGINHVDNVEGPNAWQSVGLVAGEQLKNLGSLNVAGVMDTATQMYIDLFTKETRADKLNKEIDAINKQNTINFYNQAVLNDKEQQRQAMMNYFAEGGSLEESNGVTTFRGLKHGQFGLEGIPQGIAQDGLINYVQGGGFDKNGNPLKGEIKYKDYIYGELKITKKLADKFNLPEKWIGLKYQEAADIAQQESKDRPNDPISLTTLDEWMTRLQGAQEEQKYIRDTREAAKVLDNMSTEEKATIMSSLAQPMMQEQEGIDLGQPMYKSGGKIYIKPENRGKFTALKKRTGKSASWFKAHGTPAQKKMATFALNARKWKHEDGGHLAQRGMYLDIPPYTDTSSPYYGLEGLEITPKEYIPLNVVTSDIFPDEPDNRSDYLYTSYMKPISPDAVYDKHGNIRYNDLDRMYSDSNHRPTTFDGINEEKYFDMFYHPIGNKFIYESFPADGNEKWFTALSKLPEFQALKNKPKDAKEAYNWFNAYATQERPMDDFAALVNSLRIKDSPLQTKDTTKPEGWDYLKETPSDETTPTSSLKRRKRTNNSDSTEMLRYAPAIGAGISAITAALQPKDFTLANQLRDIASEYKPVAGSPIGGYRRYNPYDINLGDIENIGLTARAIAANRGQNRATQGALNAAVISNAQKTAAQRNLAWQQANEANRLATDQYNLGIDQFNANRNTQYDQLNQQILANRLRTLMSAAQAEDLSKQAWANMYNTTHENFFNQLGNVGRDEWNRNQRDWLLNALGRDGLLELLKSGYKIS